MIRQSEAEKALSILYQKSNLSQSLLKQEILSQKIGLKGPDKAIEQYLLTWNNTIRQGVLSLAFEVVGGKLENIVPLQVALSFIDATMDIHDDIIDGSLKKKKTRTIYGKLGVGSSLLIGDLFIVRGFCQISEVIKKISEEKQALIMVTVNNFLSEVVKAHMAETQMRAFKWKVKPQVYLDILTQKAAEIEGRMKIATIFGGGSEGEVNALSKFGRNLGTLLAVRAEYTDLFDPVELSNRVKSECLPLHILYVLQKNEYKEKITEHLLKPKLTKKDVCKILDLIDESGTLATLNVQLKIMQKEAENALKTLPNNKEKKNLQLLISSIMEDM